MKSAALIIPCLLIGGTEVASLNTAKALMQLGYTVQVLVLFEEVDPLMVRAFDRYGIEVCQLQLKRRTGIDGLYNLLVRLWRALAGGRDLIWVQYMTPTFVPLIITRFRTHFLIACVHVASNHYKPFALMRLRILARWWCDRFVCVSRTTALGIFGEYITDNETSANVYVLQNALDENLINSASKRDWRKELDIRCDTLLIGYVGRMAYNKGVDVLLHAIALVVRERTNLKCVLVGNGEDRYKLESLVHELNISNYVHFAGAISQSDIYSAFKGFDILVVPSREEGFGLSAIEAMACGVPLVASAVDALCELVIDGETGILVPSCDPSALAMALNSLSNDPKMISRLKSQALANVFPSFSFEGYKSGLMRVLKNKTSDL